jgi:hypothetical protein
MFRRGVTTVVRSSRNYSTHNSSSRGPSLLDKSRKTTQPQTTQPQTKSPSQIALENKRKYEQHDLMTDIMNAVDRRHGGNNADMPRQKPDVLLSRRDNHPAKAIQPGYGTHKSAIDQNGVLQPVKKDGKTSPAMHVDGKKEVKEQSPYTSFSGVQTGVDGKAPPQLVDNPLYGNNLIITNPSKDRKMGKVLDQFDIQRDIRTSPNPELDQTAVLRSDPHPQRLWKPEPSEKQLMPSVGVDPELPQFTFRQRAMVNSARDQEYLVEGPITDFVLKVPDKNGGLKALSKDEVIELARKEKQ